jgi:RND family efflux transporter MFP subunit
MNRFLVASIVLVILIPVNVMAAEFRGLIEPHRVLKIGSPSEGILEAVDVDRGDHIRKGQVLGRLQSGVEKATMELAKARAEMEGLIKGKEAGKVLFQGKKTRVEQLHQKELASPSEMEEAHANLAISEMQLKEAQENKRIAELEHVRAQEVLKRLTIISPVNGVVVERFLSPGEYVREQPVLKIAELDPLNVEVIIPAAEFLSIRRGMQVTVIPEAPASGKYTAVVKVVDRVVDGASGTFGVRLEMPNPGYRILAGLKCKVIFPDKKNSN